MRKDDGEILEISGFLGTTTNNVAEYAGLLEALATAKAEGATEVPDPRDDGDEHAAGPR